MEIGPSRSGTAAAARGQVASVAGRGERTVGGYRKPGNVRPLEAPDVLNVAEPADLDRAGVAKHHLPHLPGLVAAFLACPDQGLFEQRTIVGADLDPAVLTESERQRGLVFVAGRGLGRRRALGWTGFVALGGWRARTGFDS